MDSGLSVFMGVRLVDQNGILQLAFDDPKKGKPFFIDFLTPDWQRKFSAGLAKNHIFRKALGAIDKRPRVCDATTGFGSDAVMALALGCEVVAFEKSPLVAKVLKNGIDRAGREDKKLKLMFARMELFEGDAVEQLRHLVPRPDVVYLDPMFDKPKKSAKSPKAMQILQELLGDGVSAADEQALFAAAWEACRSRVVVKRALKAKAIKPNPTHSYKGQSIRYDVYVRN